jgi:hypothetical protein
VNENVLLATEGSDTAAINGKVSYKGALNATEGADTAYFSRAKRIVLIPTVGSTTSFTLPSDWTDAGSVIEVYGRGGRGANNVSSPSGGGGGGGAYLRIAGGNYALKYSLAEGYLRTLNYSDTGNSSGGGYTTFGTHDYGAGISVANGVGGTSGSAGGGGTAAASFASLNYLDGPEYLSPEAKFSGGNGGAGRTSATAGGGGGGGGGGPSGAGGAGAANITATGSNGAAGGAAGGGNVGGYGGAGGNEVPLTDGFAGGEYGGGGGGAPSQTGALGGAGGTGAIILTYFPSPSNYMAAGEASGDTLTASGAVTSTSGALGSITATEATDTISASGRVRVSGALTVSESANDAAAASGKVLVRGSLTVLEFGSDTATVSGSGVTSLFGTLAVIETGSDAATATGRVAVKGIIAVVETGSDAAAATGRVAVKGIIAVIETGTDTFAAVSASPGSVSGSMSAQEQADTITFAGNVRVRGMLAVVEAADTCAAAGVIRVRGALNVIEAGNDSFIAISLSAVRGAMSAVETTADTASIRHQAASSYLGSIATLHPDVRAAFRQRLTALSGLVDSRAWEGRPFAPAKGVPWLRESVRPISSVVRGVGSGGIVEHRVVATVTLFWPSSFSLLEQELQAGSILGHFPPGLRITYGSSSATVVQAERGPLLQEPDWRSCNVTLTLTAHTIGNA